MSARDNVTRIIREWQPAELPSELKYRDSLIDLLREHLKKAKIEREYRHHGTTTDIYVQQPSLFSASEVFVELKRDLNQKSKLDRLIGQIACLKPKDNYIIVVLCGDTDPALLSRFKETYGIHDGWPSMVTVELKPKPHPVVGTKPALALRKPTTQK